jgi:carbonic anhydrase
MAPLLERNAQFASRHTLVPLGPPKTGLVIVTCMDHRVDPAVTLGIQLGETPVIRNTGGRITQSVVGDIAYLGYLAERFFAAATGGDKLFEVAIIQHTQCGAGFLANPDFRAQVAAATGLHDETLAAAAVPDPHATVRADVELLLASPTLSPRISVSGHVYDIESGRVTTVVEAKSP